MKLEKLEDNTSKVKGVIIGILLTIGLVILINYITSLARYRNTESIELASGNISYNKADLNIIAMYQESSYNNPSNGYIAIDEVPTGKYKLSSKSYCTVPETEDHITDNMEFVDGNVEIKINKRGTKCYVYFDMDYKADDMLAKLEASKQSTYEKAAMPNPITGPYNVETENSEHKEKLYTTEDNYGTSYVFRGNNNDVNNWVTFANHTWRIIRINGDGTLRLIYQCAEPNCQTTEGEETHIGTSIYKSEAIDDNTYVGYYYGEAGQETYDATHTNAHPSTIAEAVNSWYTGIGAMTNYTKYLSGDTGWCNDRTVVKDIWEDFNGNGAAKAATGYASASRLLIEEIDWRTKQYPTLKCGAVMPETTPSDSVGFSAFNETDPKALARDLFTIIGSSNGNRALNVPAALITTDEVAMAGGFAGSVASECWLNINQNYWTMSPSRFNAELDYADVMYVRNDGMIRVASTDHDYSVRPVINLNADIEFSGGNGKSSSPFIVKTNI